jgi:hypothetical protein
LIVNGKVSPLRLNALPVRFAWETVTLDPPELLRVAVRVLLLPTCTLPKTTELAVNAPAETPVPESGMAKAEPLLVIARFTVLLPVEVGAKATVNEVLCPAFKVTGKLRPLTVNPAPAATCVTVMLDPPELVKVSGRDWVPPVVTLPKLRLGALALKLPVAAAVPETGTIKLEFDASLLIERLKLSVPAACGANVMLKGTLCPARKVIGRLSPEVLYPAPENIA